ncbi:MAG: hypothetical protein CL797_10660 [Chromatiales bacterium]|nr:hypothetical protein [Chromatiales bacterium]
MQSRKNTVVKVIRVVKCIVKYSACNYHPPSCKVDDPEFVNQLFCMSPDLSARVKLIHPTVLIFIMFVFDQL